MKEFAAAKLLILIIAVGYISSSSEVFSSSRNHAVSQTAPSRKFEMGTRGSADIAVGATSFTATLSRARQKAISGGIGGFIAGVIQVVTLMWLRTTVNYQYRYGVSMFEALRELYRQGGIYRFYRGLPYAIIQGPLARFGGIAANDAAIVFAAYLTSQPEQVSKGILSTALGSILAG
jgi:Mitochondrial carrier protein